MTSTYYPLDKKERSLPDTPQSPYCTTMPHPAPAPVPAPPALRNSTSSCSRSSGRNIPITAPSPFTNNPFFSSSSSSPSCNKAQPAVARTPSHCSSSSTATTTTTSSSSSSSCSSRSQRSLDKANYKAQKKLLKDQARSAKREARFAKHEARVQAKEAKTARSLSHRQAKELSHEIKHQAKQFKHEIKHQCKELKRELKYRHEHNQYGDGQQHQGYSVPAVPSVPSVPSCVSPPLQLVQAQPALYGYAAQPILPQPSAPEIPFLVYNYPTAPSSSSSYPCKTRHGRQNRSHYSHTHSGYYSASPVRMVHNVIERTLTGVSEHLQQQVRNLQQERQQQRPTVLVAPAPLPAPMIQPTTLYSAPPTPATQQQSGSEKQVGPQDPMLIYSMSNMSLDSSSTSSSSSAPSSASSASRPLHAMPVPHAIPRPDLAQEQEYEKEEEDSSLPPPSYEASVAHSTRRA
ncbi:hypothetical protein BGX33_003916 [Mortierella sp. NVP41]|nr:hypothetical protein BGX33_003916 [Mortierella sp. NVP41]